MLHKSRKYLFIHNLAGRHWPDYGRMYRRDASTYRAAHPGPCSNLPGPGALPDCGRRPRGAFPGLVGSVTT